MAHSAIIRYSPRFNSQHECVDIVHLSFTAPLDDERSLDIPITTEHMAITMGLDELEALFKAWQDWTNEDSA